MNNKIVIIGGSAGGASVATRIRRLDEEVKIIIFEKGPYVSYSNCALPFILSDTINESEDLVLSNPEKFKTRFNINVKINNEVIDIDSNNKIITVKDTSTKEIYQEEYDKLFLSPGAIKGIDRENVFSVINVSDIVKIDNYIKEHEVKDVVVVGDAIESFHSITKKTMRLTLAGPAQRQARGAADYMYNRTVQNKGGINSLCIRVFDLNAANTGINEKECIANSIPYDFIYVIPSDSVGIMPDAKPLHLKLIFEVPTGKILGAQAIGLGAADKRIDVLAGMITRGATLEDLKELEICYSPLFSTAKDPINHAALVGLNVLNGEFKQVKVSEVRALVEENAKIIDVREKDEFAKGHLVNSINIPMSEFRDRLNEIPKDEPVYFHCRSAQRSYNVVRALGNMGYNNVYNISGSYLGICSH